MLSTKQTLLISRSHWYYHSYKHTFDTIWIDKTIEYLQKEVDQTQMISHTRDRSSIRIVYVYIVDTKAETQSISNHKQHT